MLMYDSCTFLSITHFAEVDRGGYFSSGKKFEKKVFTFFSLTLFQKKKGISFSKTT